MYVGIHAGFLGPARAELQGVPPHLPAAWIRRQDAAGVQPCSPLTNLPLSHLILRPNPAARSAAARRRASRQAWD